MRPTALIAGTGRMGRSIGLHFLRSGFAVCWLSRNTERRQAFERTVLRDAGRVARAFPGAHEPGLVAVACYDERWPAAPAVFVEAVVETREAKSAVFARVVPRLGEGALVLSSTSSFLPEDLHPEAVVVHFFHPPEVSGFVEAVWPADCPPARRERVRAVIASLGLEVLEQTGENAFAATRLLLPLQNECLRAVAEGFAPAEVDEASRSPLFPTGQITFLDRVGPSTVLTAVRNYLSRVGEAEAAGYEPLVRGLEARVETGGWGVCRAGAGGRSYPDRREPCERALGGTSRLAVGEGFQEIDDRPAAPARHTPPTEVGGVWARELLCVLLNACYRAVDLGHLDRRQLGLVLSGFFWAETEPEALVAAAGHKRVLDVLREGYRRTGIPYFLPSPSLEA